MEINPIYREYIGSKCELVSRSTTAMFCRKTLNLKYIYIYINTILLTAILMSNAMKQ